MSTTLRSGLGFPTATLVAGLALTIALLVGRVAPAAADGLAAADGPNGGRMMTGTLPRGTTGSAALQAGLRRLHGQFDAAPQLLRAVRSQDGKVTLAVFRAARHGSPLGGLAVATCDSAGHARFAALFDTPKHLPQSLPPMLNRFKADTKAALEEERPAGGRASGPDFAGYAAAAAHVSLTRTAFPDGTASIGVAHGFTPTAMGGGQFSAAASDGAYENLYLPVGLMDPNGANYRMEAQLSGGRPPQIPGQTVLAHDPDPVSAWKKLLTEKAAERGGADPAPNVLQSAPLHGAVPGFTGRTVAGTMTLHGEPYVFSGALLVSPLAPAGNWMLQITMRAAPAAHASSDMPALIAMQNSMHVDMNAVRNQTMRNIAAINAACSHWLAANKAAGDAARDRVFQSSMREAAVSQDNIDRSTAGFIHYINDTTVVQHDPTGAHGTMDANWADALVKSDPEHFHVVPSQPVRSRKGLLTLACPSVPVL